MLITREEEAAYSKKWAMEDPEGWTAQHAYECKFATVYFNAEGVARYTGLSLERVKQIEATVEGD